jgi:hypothetical protein
VRLDFLTLQFFTPCCTRIQGEHFNGSGPSAPDGCVRGIEYLSVREMKANNFVWNFAFASRGAMAAG